MLLPNVELASVDEEKVRDYLMSSEHPIGRFKAAFFRSLGYTRDEWELLRSHLLTLASRCAAVAKPADVYGQKYEVSGILEGPSGSADLMTVWIIRAGEDHPRLVTAYPK